MKTTVETWMRLTVALAAATLLGCVKGEQTSQASDSTARNLTLAPTESTAALKDVPARAAEPAKAAPERAAPEKRAPKPPPKPAVPTTLTAAAGTRVPLAASDTITTRHAKAGDAFTASVSQDVKDAAGHVVIPAGSTVQGTIDAAEPRPNPNSPGKFVLSVHSVTVHGTSYPVEGSVVAMDTVQQGRGVTKADAAKVGAGAAGRPHESPALEIQHVRQRLMVQARRGHRVRERHVLVDDVADHLIHGGRDARAAGRAEDERQPARGVEHDGGRHRRQHPLS